MTAWLSGGVELGLASEVSIKHAANGRRTQVCPELRERIRATNQIAVIGSATWRRYAAAGCRAGRWDRPRSNSFSRNVPLA